MTPVHDRRETVVLLHGLGLAGWAMLPLAWGLRRRRYRVINLSYPSRGLPLEELGGEWLPARLREHGVEHATRLHFVTHSMGGILLRQWRRAVNAPSNFRHAVMIAPPNAGSAIAERLRTVAGFRWLLGVNGRRLGVGPDSVPLALGPWPSTPGKLGILAGNYTLDLLSAGWLEKPNDGKVTVASARLEGMSDFHVIPYSHTVMLWRRAALCQVAAFLRNGAFDKT